MRILKYLLLIILLIVIAGSVYFATKDGRYDVSRSHELNAPSQVVFELVNDYRSWEKWGPWMQEDPELKMYYGDSISGVGSGYSWSSEKIGDGSIETTSVKGYSSIEQRIVFDTPLGDSPSDVYWTFEPLEEGGCRATWGMRGTHSFMEKVFLGLSGSDFDSDLGAMFESGLERLGAHAQEVMNKYEITVQGVTRYGGGYYLFITSAARTSDLAAKMGPMMAQLKEFSAQNNIQPSGMPFTIYDEIDEQHDNVIFSVAFPVSERIITPAGSALLCRYMEPVTALKTTLQGKYEYLPQAYSKAMEYLESRQDLKRDTERKMFESYRNDPGDHPNPAQWITDIYIPVVQGSTILENPDR